MTTRSLASAVHLPSTIFRGVLVILCCSAPQHILAARASAQAPSYLQRPTLPGLLQPAMAFDEARQRLVLFEGGNTWEWDGAVWTRLAPTVSPDSRLLHAMTYDRARGRVVLFGGQVSSGSPTDTWLWDGYTWARNASTVNPGARAGHAMAYDAASQRVVLYGGFGSTGPLIDTWSWDGSAWVSHTPSASPGPRAGHALATDPVTQRVMLFGGVGTSLHDTTWLWDGNNWNQQPTTNGPSPRFGHGMAYDSTRQEVVLFGGEDSQSQLLSDTWSWNGLSWTQRTLPTRPQARWGHAMAYDTMRQTIVVCCGSPSGSSSFPLNPWHFTDTWEWDGITWRVSEVAEASLGNAALAYDAARATVVLHHQAATWEWAERRWTLRLPPTSPPPRSEFAMAYDEQRQRTVLFGGIQTGPLWMQDTWEWDGTNWTQSTPPVSPSARYGHAMTYDSARQRVVLFGGDGNTATLADLWEWDGSTWTQRAPSSSPSPRAGHAMAYDSARQRVVLFGGWNGAVLHSDTWEWDGTNWIPFTPVVGPPTHWSRASMAYDSSRQRTVLAASGTWEWDGSSWSQSSPIAFPMAFDVSMQRMVVIGGRCTGTVWSLHCWSETWYYGALVPASSQPLGTGCPGSNGVPVLGSHAPTLGDSRFDLTLFESLPNSIAVFGLDLATQALPIGGGCTIYLSPTPIALLLALTNATGFARLPVPIPANPALRGLTFYTQAATLDPNGAAGGLALTAARQLVIGD